MHRRFPVFFLAIIAVFFTLFSCKSTVWEKDPYAPEPDPEVPDNPNNPGSNQTPASDEVSWPVTKVDFGGENTKTYTFDNLSGNTLYLVKVNTGDTVCAAADSGGVSTLPNSSVFQRRPLLNTKSAESGIKIEYAPPEYLHLPDVPDVPEALKSIRGPLFSYEVDTQKIFYAFTVPADESDEPGLVEAWLRVQGEHCNIWVPNANFDNSSATDDDNKITIDQARELADKFDILYGKETTLIGYERGGGPDGDGGADHDQRIQILVFDIYGDYMDPTKKTGGTLGYYFARDNLNPQYVPTSNGAEMFYVDAYFADKTPENMLLTLAHEFQHMINYNYKYVSGLKKESSDWFNEMLSQLTEDVMSDFLGVEHTDDAWTPLLRSKHFMNEYDAQALTTWGAISGSGGPEDQQISYSKAYFFGAYLVRNYGGPELLREMVTNRAVDEQSVTQALQSVTGNSALTMRSVLKRYGEAFVYSSSSCAGNIPSNVKTFDRSKSWIIGSTTYTFACFDIWTFPRISNNIFTDANGVIHGAGGLGPHIHEYSQKLLIKPLNLTLHSGSSWTGLSGSYSVTLTKPASDDIQMYLLVK